MNPARLINNWLAAVASRDPATVVNLYAYDGVLIGTVAQTIKQGHQALLGYFRGFLAKDGLHGRVDSMIIQRVGPAIILSGIYTFYWRENGRPTSLKARYSFVFAPMDRGWVILNHHSSAIP